ncbi:permease [Gemmatirosa kalamazoonensis]|uniref:Permease n=1 Tax=Gemmatirosa kalamazoonensis TaxID=861299 RepID=W0RLI4_9BACT|nr:ADOP family duplicated permease [Gemmatirosa kalamazoonensis]AHG90283.1 permease [Gemmatirosa kalamazoonensis]
MAPSEPRLPRLPLVLLGALLPRAERDELLADVVEEFGERSRAAGTPAARRWLWAQLVGSAPAVLRWRWWRGWTGFEPRANAYRPGGPMLKSWISDARYAARRLRARPGYTVLAVLTLALGVGGTAAVYGVARGLLFDPLPYANAPELATFWSTFSWSEEEFSYLRGRFPGFRQVAAYRNRDVTLRVGDAPARFVPGIAASAELFDVLGARPALGRPLRAGDDALGTAPVAVLSDGLWRELGADPSIVGRSLVLDGAPTTVVGVMPRGFWFPDPSVRVWTSTPMRPDNGAGNYTLVGRVAPGLDPGNMGPYVARLTAMLGERFHYPEKWDKTKNARVTPIRESMTGTMRPALLATLGAMGLILLIACANVAALMLGQVDARFTELAVRSALGANQRRLTQQLVVEALLIAIAAGALGAGLAAGGFRVLAHALPLGAWGETVSPDWRVFVAALGLAIAAALLVVAVPTVSLWRGDLRGVLGRARTGGLEGRGGRLENGLVVAEVALAVLIASGAALLVRSVGNLYALDPGLRAEQVAVVDVVAPNDIGGVAQWRAVDEVVTALHALPGVRAVAATTQLPLRGGSDSYGFTIEGLKDTDDGSTTYMRIVTQEYFAALGIRRLTGRTFELTDRRAADSVRAETQRGERRDSTPPERVVVINQALAKKYFRGESPIGRRMGGTFRGAERIIGVVVDVAEGKLTDAPEPARYFLADEVPMRHGTYTLALRVSPGIDPTSVLDAARRTVSRLAPGFAVQELTTMQRVLDRAVGPARQVMTLLSLLTGLALVLGAIGIYGVIAHFAARRRRDWAIRVALGLPGGRVVARVLGHGTALVAVGIVIGVAAASVLARLLSALLFGVSAFDPLALAGAGVALLVVGFLAAAAPAWRAGMTDPAIALREQ